MSSVYIEGIILSLLSLVHTNESSLNSFKEAIQNSLDLIRFNPEADTKKVVIKPNLCYYYDYSTGETTDPKFVSALIDVFRECMSSNLDISVVESDASAMRCKYAFRMLDYEKMAKEKGVRLVNLAEEKNENAEVRIGDKYLRFQIPEIIRESDLFVNVPKIKYQHGVKITCALKNVFGCNAYQKKYVYHKALSEAIAGINKLITSNLVVVDGIVVRGVASRRLGLVMASEDPVAVDAAASKILGVNPKAVKHITLASMEGVGNMNFIECGESLPYFRELFPRRRTKHKIRNFLASVYSRYFR